VDADKVHHGVVGARVHDKPAVIADPHGHVSLTLRQLLCEGALPDFLMGNHKPERALAGSKGHNLRTSDDFAGDGLETGVSL
jgi:hypothetical protein